MTPDKVALITGAASGIGAALSRRFLEAGYRVAMLDIDERSLEAMASRLQLESQGIAIHCDVADEASVKDAVERTILKLGSVDVLINNAAIEINGTVVDQPAADWDRQIAVNLKGVFLCSKYSIPDMRKRSGCILNISSVHAFVSWPACPAYDASKAALLGLTRAMAVDHGRDGIRVNAICPGYIETPLLEAWFRSGAITREEAVRLHPLGRIGTPDDIAQAALFLASGAASFISGTVLTVDGGLTACGR